LQALQALIPQRSLDVIELAQGFAVQIREPLVV
jgi:hypothetical protein